jgi:hypothetical protein
LKNGDIAFALARLDAAKIIADKMSKAAYQGKIFDQSIICAIK